MGFRSIEISNPAEVHIKNGQMHVEQDTGIATIPLEDIATITCIGTNIRFSTMGLSKLAEHGITMQCIDQHYKPQAIVLPNVNNVRQTLITHQQILMSQERIGKVWKQIVVAKIENQARTLCILGLEGAEKILEYSLYVRDGDVTNREAVAAKEYFEYYHKGLNRKTSDPLNSCLNYGYAVIRNAIIRSAIASGFLMSWGLFHRNQFNAFNLADDLIEAWRPMVDLIAHSVVNSNEWLSKEQRRQLGNVLHNSCMIADKKTTILAGIDIMMESFQQYVLDENVKSILLPTILPIETIGLITE